MYLLEEPESAHLRDGGPAGARCFAVEQIIEFEQSAQLRDF